MTEFKKGGTDLRIRRGHSVKGKGRGSYILGQNNEIKSRGKGRTELRSAKVGEGRTVLRIVIG